MKNWPNPFIEQRADPYILRHQDSYYFIASVPEYDRLEIDAQPPLKACATRSRWSSGVSRTTAQ